MLRKYINIKMRLLFQNIKLRKIVYREAFKKKINILKIIIDKYSLLKLLCQIMKKYYFSFDKRMEALWQI